MGSASEWALAQDMWLALRFALTDIIQTIRMVARLTATMVLAGLRAGSLSALDRGITGGDIRIIQLAALWDVVTSDAATLDTAMLDMAMLDTGRLHAVAQASMVAGSAVVAN